MAARSARAAKALAFLAERDPALAALALWCTFRDGEGPTATRGETIRIGPEFDALPLREQVGLIGHHVLHVALRHAPRLVRMRMRLGAALDAGLFNLGADAIVNGVLDAGGHALPRPAVLLADLLDRVLEAPEDDRPPLGTWDVERLYFALAALDADGQGRRAEYEGETGFAPDLDSGDAGAAEGDPEEAAWQGRLARAGRTAGAAGRGIGTVLSALADWGEARVAWEVTLRGLLARAVAEHPRRSHARPRRAWIAAEAAARATDGPRPVFEPGQARADMQPRIVVGWDTSGSITDTALTLFGAEIAGIARRVRAELHVLCFDEAVYARLRPGPGDWRHVLAAARLRREGGTSFAQVLDEAQRLAPSVIVMLSDLRGAFGRRPSCPVIWVTPDPDAPEPPFGRVLNLVG